MAEPSSTSECVTEALYGEQLETIEKIGDWARVCLKHDGYSGFVRKTQLRPAAALSQCSAESSFWVFNRSTLLFSEPNMKSAVLHRIPFGSELQLQPSDTDSFSKTACGHYVWTDHCLRADQHYPDDVITLASSHFLGAPYRWGGRSTEGADCSGLVQVLARSQGLFIPRDSGEQEDHIRTQVPLDERTTLDLVYWPGHTGILMSATHLLHATAFSLDCRIELLDDVVERAGQISSIRRLFDSSHT